MTIASATELGTKLEAHLGAEDMREYMWMFPERSIEHSRHTS